jgi:hypothetical protein
MTARGRNGSFGEEVLRHDDRADRDAGDEARLPVLPEQQFRRAAADVHAQHALVSDLG